MKRIALSLIAFTLTAIPVFAQPTSWSEVDPAEFNGGTASVEPWDAEAFGTLTFYADRPTFQAAFPGLLTEDFSDGLTAPGGINTCTDLPSSSTSNDACFQPGDIEVGFSTLPSVGDNVVLGTGFAGINCFGHGANTFTDDFQMDLGPAVRAIAFELTGCGPENLDIEVFGPGGSLGMTTLQCPALGTTIFFGVDSVDPGGITQITTVASAGGGELVCNVEFGGIPFPVELESFSID